MKITRQNECPCRLSLYDLEPGDVFRFGDPEYSDDVFMVILKIQPPEYTIRKYGMPRQWSPTCVLNLANGKICGKFRPRITRHVIKLCAELVVAEDES